MSTKPQWPSAPAAAAPSRDEGSTASGPAATSARSTASPSVAPVVAVSQPKGEAEQARSEGAGRRPTDERRPRRALRGILAVAGAAVALAAIWGAFQSGSQRHRSDGADQTAPGVTVPLESDRAADTPSSAAVENAPAPEPGGDSLADEGTVESAAAERSADPAGLAAEPFGREEAFLELERAARRAGRCGRAKTGQTVRVSVTFEPTGRAGRVYLLPGPLSGTPTGWCIQKAFQSVKVSPFDGERVTLHKDVQVLPHRAAASPGVAVPEEL
jgi:hypothetical protein